MDNLLIVTTGGTIDKVYFDDKSDFQVGDPQIGGILRELGVDEPIDYTAGPFEEAVSDVDVVLDLVGEDDPSLIRSVEVLRKARQPFALEPGIDRSAVSAQIASAPARPSA